VKRDDTERDVVRLETLMTFVTKQEGFQVVSLVVLPSDQSTVESARMFSFYPGRYAVHDNYDDT
jgi:hypothetical protein